MTGPLLLESFFLFWKRLEDDTYNETVCTGQKQVSCTWEGSSQGEDTIRESESPSMMLCFKF